MVVVYVLLGISVTCATIGVILSAVSSKDPNVIRTQIKNATERINVCSNIREQYIKILDNIDASKKRLSSSYLYFKNGGYVYQNEPLAKDAYNECYNNLTKTREYVSNVIKNIEDEKEELKVALYKLNLQLTNIEKKSK